MHDDIKPKKGKPLETKAWKERNMNSFQKTAVYEFELAVVGIRSGGFCICLHLLARRPSIGHTGGSTDNRQICTPREGPSSQVTWRPKSGGLCKTERRSS